MAIYFLRLSHVSRGNGSRVTSAAAYRAGERIRDERNHRTDDHSHRRDITHKEIMLAAEQSKDPAVQWARERSVLWNAAESFSDRRNACLAAEVLVVLPSELPSARRVDLARSFGQQLADRYHGAVDLAVHEPRAGDGHGYHHAHMLMTTREITPQGLGQRITLQLNGQQRIARGLEPGRYEFDRIRAGWADTANLALREAGLEARLDHRSYAQRGLNQEPVAPLPRAIYYAERNAGRATALGDLLRAEHRQRVAAREHGPEELARVVQLQKEAARRYVASKDLRQSLATFARENPTPTADGSVSRWLAYVRAEDATESVQGKTAGHERDASKSRADENDRGDSEEHRGGGRNAERGRDDHDAGL